MTLAETCGGDRKSWRTLKVERSGNDRIHLGGKGYGGGSWLNFHTLKSLPWAVGVCQYQRHSYLTLFDYFEQNDHLRILIGCIWGIEGADGLAGL